MKLKIEYKDFEKIDIRVGRILEVSDFPEARKPAYKLKIDLGIKNSSAQITVNYKKEELMNKLVLCVVNFEPKQIGPFISEVLTLGVPDENGEVVLIEPTGDVPVGGRLY